MDATPFRHDGRWWLFYSGAADKRSRQSELRCAFADRLTGPWRAHPANPVRIGRNGSRPGGTAQVIDGVVMLPVQDCSTTYGGAIRPLRLTRIDPHGIETELGDPILAPADAAPFREGLHTLAACGDVTLVDVKRVDRTGRGWLLDAQRLLAR